MSRGWRAVAIAMTALALLLGAALFVLWRRHERLRALSRDWAGVTVYAEVNRRDAAGQGGFVLIGDSIAERWQLDQSFPRQRALNRGLSSQNTSQVLARFRSDALELHPRAIVVLAGSNDLAAGTALPEAVTRGNFQSLAELARAQSVKLVVVSVLPTFPDAKGLPWRSNDRIAELNRWLRDFAAKQGIEYADCYSAMVAPGGQLRREFSDDGLHPNAAGFRAMTPIVQAALDRALR
ncbi:MAG TPA: GDSL-type esterase/lipase family protein [Terriglobales bacterium]|nr:GDSL-type esterase/lipase family protein [Terriglobales bacterium]